MYIGRKNLSQIHITINIWIRKYTNLDEVKLDGEKKHPFKARQKKVSNYLYPYLLTSSNLFSLPPSPKPLFIKAQALFTAELQHRASFVNSLLETLFPSETL